LIASIDARISADGLVLPDRGPPGLLMTRLKQEHEAGLEARGPVRLLRRNAQPDRQLTPVAPKAAFPSISPCANMAIQYSRIEGEVV
jgi:hypothetical protein